MRLVVTLLVLWLVCSPWLAAESIAQTIRVATFNVNWANRNGSQILEAIDAANADILCLQETTPPLERFLRRRLANRYPEFHAAGHEGRYGAERFAFASKAKPSGLKFHPPDAGLFGFYDATYRFDDLDIRILNVHLTPFLLSRDSSLRKAMSVLSATEDKHAKEIEAILSTVDVARPTIIVGDFNSMSVFNAPVQLVARGLVDSFAAVHDDADAQPSWSWPTRPLPLELRIDYIFHTDHLVTIESKIIRSGGSDHFPVVSELQYANKVSPAASAKPAASAAPAGESR